MNVSPRYFPSLISTQRLSTQFSAVLSNNLTLRVPFLSCNPSGLAHAVCAWGAADARTIVEVLHSLACGLAALIYIFQRHFSLNCISSKLLLLLH